jgi:hypothetical protein
VLVADEVASGKNGWNLRTAHAAEDQAEGQRRRNARTAVVARQVSLPGGCLKSS